jgi:hypothetical protein
MKGCSASKETLLAGKDGHQFLPSEIMEHKRKPKLKEKTVCKWSEKNMDPKPECKNFFLFTNLPRILAHC